MSDIHELIEASSLGTPHAKRMRALASGMLAARLTGMPEEQADWESDEDEGAFYADPYVDAAKQHLREQS